MPNLTAPLTPDREKEAFARYSALPIQQFVFNGVVSNVTASEISSVLLFGSRPLAQLIIAPVVAKALARELTNMVARYERITGIEIPDYDAVNAKLNSDLSNPDV